MTTTSKYLVSAVVVLLSGCCSCAERYGPFLEQVEENLRDDIRPKYERALQSSGRDPLLIQNDLGIVDDTIHSIQRVREAGLETNDE